MDSQTPDRTLDQGTAYSRKPSDVPAELTEVGRGTPMGELLRRYWHPVGLSSHATEHAARGAHARRGPGAVPRRRRPSGPGLGALLPSRHHPLLRQGRGARHPLLLSRLAVRRGRPLPRPALRAGRRREAPRPRAAALVPGGRALRPGVRLHGAAGEKAAAAALRRARGTRAGRIHRRRRHQHRFGRRRDRALQLAAALRERHGSLPRAHPARHLQRHAVRAGDEPHARGRVRAHAARRQVFEHAQARRRQDHASRHRSRAAHAARGAEPLRRQVRQGREHRLDDPDRRHALPHLHRRPRDRKRACCCRAPRTRPSAKRWREHDARRAPRDAQ